MTTRLTKNSIVRAIEQMKSQLMVKVPEAVGVIHEVAQGQGAMVERVGEGDIGEIREGAGVRVEGDTVDVIGEVGRGEGAMVEGDKSGVMVELEAVPAGEIGEHMVRKQVCRSKEKHELRCSKVKSE